MLEPRQVTCVIPYAGAERYVAEVVGSALAQRFGEVLIINDGFPPAQLAAVAALPGVRIIHLPKSAGCPNARNLGIKNCTTPYVVLLDHDDVLCPGYFPAIAAWVHERKLRCAAATLRYIGEDAGRIGVCVSRHPDFFLPSGFLAEVSLLAEIGYFQESIWDDLLLFRAIRKVTPLTTCPGAGVLYRIHPQSESSRNTKAWWAFLQLLPLYDSGSCSLAEANAIARKFAADGTIPAGLASYFTGEDSATVRFLSRSAYACWLNRDIPGLARYSFKLAGHAPELWRLARYKWLHK